MASIRRAKIEDALGIHEAHMRSIREVCSKVHSQEEISGWGNRDFDRDRRINAISNQKVWVVEEQGKIEGFAELHFREIDGKLKAHLMGLYLTANVLNQGIGSRLMDLIFDEVRAAKIFELTLDSTLNAHAFYLRHGFRDKGPMQSAPIGGVLVRCYPMAIDVDRDNSG